jgi:hypothetical protein
MFEASEIRTIIFVVSPAMIDLWYSRRADGLALMIPRRLG